MVDTLAGVYRTLSLGRAHPLPEIYCTPTMCGRMWCVIKFRFGARVPQSYKLAEPREFDSPSITQPAHTGVFL